MYIKYAYVPGATYANMLADIIAIICNNSTFASLSAACDQAASSILANSSTSNWAVYDAAASATSQVVRSLNADGSTYKYLQVDLTAATITCKAWESWNAGTHAGTNQAASGAAVKSPTLAVSANTSGGYLYVMATNFYVFLMTPQLNTVNKVGVVEFSRDTPSLSSAYPCHAIYHSLGTVSQNATGSPRVSSGAGGFGVCRLKAPSAAGDLAAATINQQFFNMAMPYDGIGTTLTQSNSGGGALDTAGVPYLLTVPVVLACCGYSAAAARLVMLGLVLGNIKAIPPDMPAFSSGDELLIGGVTHVLLTEGLGALAIPKV